MSTPVRSLTRAALRNPDDKLEILSFPNFTYYDYLFENIAANFHLYHGSHLQRKWDFNQRKLPPNFKIDIDPDIPLNLDMDLILYHDRFTQFDLANHLSAFWHLPTCLVHGTTTRDMKFIPQWNTINRRDGHSNIFLSEKIQESWDKPGYIVPVGINTLDLDISKQRRISHISVDSREIKILHNLLGPINYIREIDLSETLIFINTTSNWYPIHVLQAMGAGCCVISQYMAELEGVIEHGENGLMFKTLEELQQYVNTFRANPDRCIEMGQKAKQKIKENFNMDNFVKLMTIALRESAEVLYIK